jgi:SAM-dependent methyltransferase
MRTDVREVFSAAAAAYGRGNPLLAVERDETPRLLPRLEGRDVLDLGCGHGHYARLALTLGARRVLALDCAAPMAAAAPAPAVVADAGRLPLRNARLDVVVASLLLSFVADPRGLLREVARVLRPGGALVASDLHPAASARGWSRSFEDGQGRTRVIDAPPLPLPELRAGLGAAGLVVADWNEPVVDERLLPEFRRAGRRDFEALRGAALLVTLRAVKGNPS